MARLLDLRACLPCSCEGALLPGRMPAKSAPREATRLSAVLSLSKGIVPIIAPSLTGWLLVGRLEGEAWAGACEIVSTDNRRHVLASTTHLFVPSGGRGNQRGQRRPDVRLPVSPVYFCGHTIAPSCYDSAPPLAALLVDQSPYVGPSVVRSPSPALQRRTPHLVHAESVLRVRQVSPR